MRFEDEVGARVERNSDNATLKQTAQAFMRASVESKYSYNFSWLGRPIIQYPQDMIAMQEIIWRTQPDLIIETGVAHGGSLILSASMLELNILCGGPTTAQVIGIDIDIRSHNRAALEAHPLSRRIQMIQGSSVELAIVKEVQRVARQKHSVLVCLDSNHTYDHVLAELEAYAPLVSVGNYCVVFDTVIEDLPAELWNDRPWGPANNPKAAVRRFLEKYTDFEIDRSVQNQLLITVAPDGYLKRLR